MTPVFNDPRGTNFIRFLDRISQGQWEQDDWSQFAGAHYGDERLEEARRELVRTAVSIENWSWPRLPEVVRSKAAELSNRLSQ